MPVQSNSSNHNVAIFLSFLYATISISARSLTVLPDTGAAEFRLGIFIPALASIVYGPLAGGLTAGVGNLLIDTYDVVTGQLDTLTFDRVLGSVSNFVGAYLSGWFARKARGTEEKVVRLRLIPAYTMASIIGLALVTGGLIGYGILYLYSGLPVAVAKTVFEAIFFYNSVVLAVMMGLSLLVYKFFNAFQERRFRGQDEKNRELQVEYIEKGVKVSKIELPEHSLWVGEWSRLNVEVRNSTKTPETYRFELVSDALLFPQIDRSNRLNPGEKFVQTFYVMPKQHRDIRMRLHVNGKRSKKSTVANITATSTVVYKQDSLAGFSSVNVLVFVISVLWSNVMESLNRTFTFDSQNVILISTVVLTELLVIVIYAVWNLRRFRRRMKEFSELDLALTSDHRSYRVSEGGDLKGAVVSRGYGVVIFLLRILVASITLVLLYEGYLSIFTDNQGILPDRDFLLPEIALAALVIAVLSEGVLNPDSGESVTVGEASEHVLQSFIPARPFKMGETNEVTVSVRNTLRKDGIRVVFKSSDFISPEVVELKLGKGQEATFKIAVTPLEAGVQNMLFAVYPLFNKDGKYIDFHETEVIHFQTVRYNVLETTVLGMTNDQFEFLKNLAGLGTILVGAILTMNQFVGIDDLILKFRDSLPVIIVLQIPLIYLYFYFSNKYSR